MNNHKKRIVRAKCTVKQKKYVTPRYIRIILTAPPDKLQLMKEATIGDNNKIFLPTTDSKTVSFSREESIIRTYTNRYINPDNNEITIDFVTHGNDGPASIWAQQAQKGDSLGVAMKLNNKSLYPEVDHYLLIGDLSALPVISVILETLPASATANVVLEVFCPDDEIKLYSKAKTDIKWLHNPHPQQGSQLSSAIKSLNLPSSQMRRFAYVAAEYRSIKRIRYFLRQEKQWASDELYAYSYWKAGQAEDESEANRRKERQ
jgi:NADPH-dependent ferric siderophore reductase